MKFLPLATIVLAAAAVTLASAPAEAGRKCTYKRNWAKAKDLKPGPWCGGGCRGYGFIRFCREICEGDRRWNPEWLR